MGSMRPFLKRIKHSCSRGLLSMYKTLVLAQLRIKPGVFVQTFYSRLREEDLEFEATLGYKGSLVCFLLLFIFTYTMLLYFKMVKDFGE